MTPTLLNVLLACLVFLAALVLIRLLYATAWFIIVVILAALAGCAPTPHIAPRPVTYEPMVPMALLNCQPNPMVPTGTIKQSDVAQYIVDLWGAGQDCRDKLKAVRIQLGGDQALG